MARQLARTAPGYPTSAIGVRRRTAARHQDLTSRGVHPVDRDGRVSPHRSSIGPRNARSKALQGPGFAAELTVKSEGGDRYPDPRPARGPRPAGKWAVGGRFRLTDTSLGAVRPRWEAKHAANGHQPPIWRVAGGDLAGGTRVAIGGWRLAGGPKDQRRRSPDPASRRRATGSQTAPARSWRPTASTTRSPGTASTAPGTAQAKAPPLNAIGAPDSAIGVPVPPSPPPSALPTGIVSHAGAVEGGVVSP